MGGCHAVAVPGEPVWRVLTWNVRGSARPELEAIAAVMRDLRPDAVAMQEIRRRQTRDLARLLGWRSHWGRKHSPYSPLLRWLDEGHAILTPHRLVDPVRRSISPGVSTWTYRHRIVLAATIERDAGEQGAGVLRLYDAHLAAHGAVDERIAQAERITALALAEGVVPRVIAGDLNAHDEPEVIRAMHTAGVRDRGGGPTNPPIAPSQRLDYVLVPEDATVTAQVEVEGGEDWAELSDHLPVLVEFRVAT
jgi:exodeoxyribonuclease-3